MMSDHPKMSRSTSVAVKSIGAGACGNAHSSAAKSSTSSPSSRTSDLPPGSSPSSSSSKAATELDELGAGAGGPSQPITTLGAERDSGNLRSPSSSSSSSGALRAMMGTGGSLFFLGGGGSMDVSALARTTGFAGASVLAPSDAEGAACAWAEVGSASTSSDTCSSAPGSVGGIGKTCQTSAWVSGHAADQMGALSTLPFSAFSAFSSP